MKKQHRPKLQLNVETVRALTAVQLDQLGQVAGGAYKSTEAAATNCSCTSSNFHC